MKKPMIMIAVVLSLVIQANPAEARKRDRWKKGKSASSQACSECEKKRANASAPSDADPLQETADALESQIPLKSLDAVMDGSESSETELSKYKLEFSQDVPFVTGQRIAYWVGGQWTSQAPKLNDGAFCAIERQLTTPVVVPKTYVVGVKTERVITQERDMSAGQGGSKVGYTVTTPITREGIATEYWDTAAPHGEDIAQGTTAQFTSASEAAPRIADSRGTKWLELSLPISTLSSYTFTGKALVDSGETIDIQARAIKRGSNEEKAAVASLVRYKRVFCQAPRSELKDGFKMNGTGKFTLGKFRALMDGAATLSQ